MTTNPMDTRAAWLGHKIADAELLLNSTLTRESELELMQLAQRIQQHAKAVGITPQTSNVRLATLLRNVA